VKKLLVGSAALIGLAGANPANSADIVPTPAYKAQVWNWTGFYGGAHAGASWGTSTFSDPFGPSIFGDKVQASGFLAGGQIGYNWQTGPWIFGLEGDASWLTSDGTNTCLASSGNFVSANCHAHPDALGSLTGRVARVVGADGRTLLYAKGGGAWLHGHVDVTTNNLFFGGAAVSQLSTSSDFTKWGWTVGAGAEQALTPAWSLKLEYNYLNFGSTNVATPISIFIVDPVLRSFVVAPGNSAGVKEDFHVVKIGLNYKFGMDPRSQWEAGPAAVPYPAKAPREMAWAPGWEVDVGGRYWYSWGRFQKNLSAGFVGGSLPSSVLVSRVTYDGMNTHSGEFYGRVDTPFNVFVKGFIGGGKTGSGHVNDEDWGLLNGVNTAVAYSNTLSDRVDGPLSYATIDLGYDFLRAPVYKVGVFAGYNYLQQKMNAFGCLEIAGPLVCTPGNPPVVVSTAVFTENDKWQSLRMGFAGDFMLADRLKLNAEVAYLPYVKFTGEDNHFFVDVGTLAEIFQESGQGRGVQAQAMLSYDITDQFSIGAGARYWAMWTTSAQVNLAFSALTFPAPATPPQNFRAAVEQAGVLAQASYKFGAPPAVVGKY